MPRVPRATPKKPGPYIPQQPELLYRPAPRQPPRPPVNPTPPKAIKPRNLTPFYAVSSLFAVTVAFYGSSLYVTTSRASSHDSHIVATQKDVSNVYDRTASSFDADVGLSEWLMGITRTRKSLAKQCKGDVLEVSSGTARNLGFYRFGKQDGVRSLTLVDLSKEMVEQGQAKWEVLNAGSRIRGSLNVPVRFMRGDAGGDMPGPPPPTEVDEKGQVRQLDSRDGAKKGYDVVFQTMGLCSTPSPALLLRNLSRYIDPANPDAKIILLEHGRSYYQWLNRILDSQALAHADQHGCWWNRDIGAIVEESGLEVLREKRKHFGTTWIYELRPKKEPEDMKQLPVVEEQRNNERAASNSWIPKWS
ncbi:hypothetical protein MBLNU459_g1099t1 [Dothideomycetes sp. NU459]